MTPEDYYKQLEITILRNQELEKENEELKKENEDLKKKLLYYENPNTPPSARQLEKAAKPSTENIPIPKKRGAPIGHKGATRPTKLATARLQGKNGFEELEKVLRQELCLS